MDFTCSNFAQAGHIERIRRYSTSSACLHSPTVGATVGAAQLMCLELYDCFKHGSFRVNSTNFCKSSVVSLHVVKDGGSPIPYRFLTMHPPSLANDRNIPHPFIYQLIYIISHNSIVKLNNTFCLRSSMY